jgi:hypothetical protein
MHVYTRRSLKSSHLCYNRYAGSEVRYTKATIRDGFLVLKSEANVRTHLHVRINLRKKLGC